MTNTQGANATAEDHLASVDLSNIPGDTTFISSHFGGETVMQIAALIEAAMVPPPSTHVVGLEWRRSGWVEAFAKPEGLGLWYSIQPAKPVHGPGDPPFTCNAIWGEPGQNMRDCLGEDFPTLDAAKTAAQADFAKRIQYILSPSPQPNVLAQGEIEIVEYGTKGTRGMTRITPDDWWFKLPTGHYKIIAVPLDVPSPQTNLDVAERLKAYVKHARENVDLMKSKTVRPDVVELASCMCDDLEELVLYPSPQTRALGGET